MELYISLTSPYARKALMVVIEKGLKDRVQVKLVIPWNNPPELTEKNPLSQVPVLVLDNGENLFDSRVICAYLDELNDQPQLIPSTGFERISVLRMEALADGMTDAAVTTFFARQANGDNPDTPAIERQINKMYGALDLMQAGLSDFAGKHNLGTIAYGASLSYLDLRYAELEWRGRVPQLAAWFEEIDKRPAMVETVPVT